MSAPIICKSQNPDIDLPRHISVWSWLFDSPQFSRRKDARGFTDVITGRHITFRELKQLTTYFSTALLSDLGLSQGSSIVVYAKNSVLYPVVMLSGSRVGIVACGVSPEYSSDELAYALTTSNAKCLLTSNDNWDKACRAAKKVGLDSSKVIVLEGTPSGRQSVEALIQKSKEQGDKAQASPFHIPRGKTNHDVCAYLGFSSGTTGLPKGVMISHANVIAQCLQILQITPSNHDKILAALPFYHITGVVHQLHLPVALNANVYVLSSFTLERLLQTVSQNKIREVLLVPPILIRLVRDKEVLSKYELSHVRRFSSGAAPLPQEIVSLLEKKFPGTGFKQGYGMTESCSCITAHPPSKYAYKYASRVGTIVASTEVRIVNPDTGKDCNIGEAGEIWARGPQVAMGYLNNAKATAETFDKDGFLHTGDIGVLDHEGLLAITDRLKEMVKVKGIGVAPAELENLLLGHPAVLDCAVSGIPDDRAGERPKAFVVLHDTHKDNATSTAKELIQFVKDNKTRYKWIAEVEILDEIPKSAAGKILRKNLRATSRKQGQVIRDEQTSSKL